MSKGSVWKKGEGGGGEHTTKHEAKQTDTTSDSVTVSDLKNFFQFFFQRTILYCSLHLSPL